MVATKKRILSLILSMIIIFQGQVFAQEQKQLENSEDVIVILSSSSLVVNENLVIVRPKYTEQLIVYKCIGHTTKVSTMFRNSADIERQCEKLKEFRNEKEYILFLKHLNRQVQDRAEKILKNEKKQEALQSVKSYSLTLSIALFLGGFLNDFVFHGERVREIEKISAIKYMNRQLVLGAKSSTPYVPDLSSSKYLNRDFLHHYSLSSEKVLFPSERSYRNIAKIFSANPSQDKQFHKLVKEMNVVRKRTIWLIAGGTFIGAAASLHDVVYINSSPEPEIVSQFIIGEIKIDHNKTSQDFVSIKDVISFFKYSTYQP